MQSVSSVDQFVSRRERVGRRVADALIGGYQRYLSPYKGFSCAYRVVHEGESCSSYTRRLIAERGIHDALPLLRARFKACGEAHRLKRSRSSPSLASMSEETSNAPVPSSASGSLTPTEAETPSQPPIQGGITRSTNRRVARRTAAGGGTGGGLWGCDIFDCSFLTCEAIDCGSCACDSLDLGACSTLPLFLLSLF